ncbi:MAG: helix-turn-helix domain-containing protein [Actinobacteria bacterium]|nr:helix-turn-helix domain-containing protein [Actinomycetota bacterium]
MSVDPTSIAELFPEQVLLVEEVAERLRISTRTVTRAIEAGRLVSLKDSLGCHRILRSAVVDWLAGARQSEDRELAA